MFPREKCDNSKNRDSRSDELYRAVAVVVVLAVVAEVLDDGNGNGTGQAETKLQYSGQHDAELI